MAAGTPGGRLRVLQRPFPTEPTSSPNCPVQFRSIMAIRPRAVQTKRTKSIGSLTASTAIQQDDAQVVFCDDLSGWGGSTREAEGLYDKRLRHRGSSRRDESTATAFEPREKVGEARAAFDGQSPAASGGGCRKRDIWVGPATASSRTAEKVRCVPRRYPGQRLSVVFLDDREVQHAPTLLRVEA